MSAGTELVVPARFCGPARSGNGGWTCGALASHLPAGTAVSVRLLQPPPLDTPMAVASEDGAVVAQVDGSPIARAMPVDAALAPVAAVPADEARAAEASYPGLASHPFPTCFSCGTAREPGDGLRIFPGRVSDLDGATRMAATWTPDPSVVEDARHLHASEPVTWAALDCISAWAADVGERPMVLGTMTARVDGRPRIGEEHVVVGLDRGEDGRKRFTAASLYDASRRLVATAEHVWITVDPAAFN